VCRWQRSPQHKAEDTCYPPSSWQRSLILRITFNGTYPGSFARFRHAKSNSCKLLSLEHQLASAGNVNASPQSAPCRGLRTTYECRPMQRQQCQCRLKGIGANRQRHMLGDDHIGIESAARPWQFPLPLVAPGPEVAEANCPRANNGRHIVSSARRALFVSHRDMLNTLQRFCPGNSSPNRWESHRDNQKPPWRGLSSGARHRLPVCRRQGAIKTLLV